MAQQPQKRPHRLAGTALAVATALGLISTPHEIRAQSLLEQLGFGDVAVQQDGSTAPRQRRRDRERDNDSRIPAGLPYGRVAPAQYADGIGAMMSGPDLRYLSNRVFADGAQNLFSENGVTQWAWTWGQFVDHNIGLRQGGDEVVQQPFDEFDPLEHFSNSANALSMTRSAAAPGTGVTTPREQINTVTPLLDGWAVYGSRERQEWLREGPVDGDRRNNGARLLMSSDNTLPTANARGDATSAPEMEIVGRLRADVAGAETVVTGDVRANENIGLTAAHTLFAREHNRLVSLLPADWSEQRKFQAARQLVIATTQYITYNEFLPALGVQLPAANGYQPNVDARVTNEFATVGFRAHSMIHGEIEMAVDVGHFSESELAAFADAGIEIEVLGSEVELAVPLNVAFANPRLLASLGVGPVAAGLGAEAQYLNDEQIDNQLRSVLFQLPRTDITNPDACLDGVELPTCFNLVSDLGALDVFRQRDHGIPDYNSLRVAYGLPAVGSFTEITGEATADFDRGDPLLAAGDAINNPAIMDFVELRDAEGNVLIPGTDAADGEAVVGVRRSTLAARLQALYGDVDQVDAFVGMVSEPRPVGSDLGELQHAMWAHQFAALRDGDPRFYLWNDDLASLVVETGLSYQQTLTDVIVNNTALLDGDIQPNVFLVSELQ